MSQPNRADECAEAPTTAQAGELGPIMWLCSMLLAFLALGFAVAKDQLRLSRRRRHSLRAVSGPVIRPSTGRTDTMMATEAASPAATTR